MFDRLPSYRFPFEKHTMEVPNFHGGHPDLIGFCLEPEYEGSVPCGAVLFLKDNEEAWCHFCYWRIAEILKDLGRDEEAEEVKAYEFKRITYEQRNNKSE